MHDLKITVTGDLYSGKSSLVKRLADHYNLNTYSVGKIQRENAMKMGVSIADYNKYVKENNLDAIIDNKIVEIGRSETNFICDAHMAWNFIPDSIKVCLIVDIDVACLRALVDYSRGSAESYSTLIEAKESILNRQFCERTTFLELYHVDKSDLCNYNIVVDTSCRALEEVFDIVVTAIDRRLKCLEIEE